MSTTITTIPNGPLKVDGVIELLDGEGKAFATKEATYLCRCGASANRPFCDGAHKAAGFAAAETAAK